jgi:hypothetical protein
MNCGKPLTTGDTGFECNSCKEKRNTTFDMPLTKDDLLKEETLKDLAKALKPYLDSIENCEVKK